MPAKRKLKPTIQPATRLLDVRQRFKSGRPQQALVLCSRCLRKREQKTPEPNKSSLIRFGPWRTYRRTDPEEYSYDVVEEVSPRENCACIDCGFTLHGTTEVDKPRYSTFFRFW